jgi:outer membrane lipoprotein-sorting protein
MKKLLILLLCSLLVIQSTSLLAATPKDKADLQRVQDYMNTMPPTHAQFIQQTSDGQTYEGEFWIRRPGRLRFEYQKPSHNFVVADGLFIHFWDEKMKQTTDAPIGQTLADFILKDKVSFNEGVRVTSVKHHDGLLEITVVQTADPGAGDLTLVFADQPLSLHAWRVKDATGRISQVSLINETEGHFDPALFIYKEPQ